MYSFKNSSYNYFWKNYHCRHNVVLFNICHGYIVSEPIISRSGKHFQPVKETYVFVSQLTP